MQKNKLCPFDKHPCIREECMAWSGKEDLEEVERENGESFKALLEVTAIQQGCSIEAARKIIEIRNNDERCKIITPEPPV